MNKKSKQNAIVSKNKGLSIQLSLGGFSFCVKDLDTKNNICFTEYTFETPVHTLELLYEKVIQIFNQDKVLQQDFNKVNVIHQNNLVSLVPSPYFDESKLKTYLNYNIKTLPYDYVTFDICSAINAKVVYIPYVNINNYLFQNFGAFEFNHHATVLLEKLLSYTKKNIDNGFFVNVHSKSIDIVVIQNNKLLLYNTFTYNTKEDFIYYILFVTEQLSFDTNEFNLTFLGKIDTTTEIYKITYDYIRNIDFIKSETSFFNPSDDFDEHSNYTLIS